MLWPQPGQKRLGFEAGFRHFGIANFSSRDLIFFFL